jgi:hypothetical protein
MKTSALTLTTLFLLTGSPAYAQQISYYSYGVAGDYDAFAWSVIDDGGMYGEIHTPTQSATLRSPSGRSAATSYSAYRIDLSLPLDGEYGNFIISTYHSLWCTYLGWIIYQVTSAYAIDVAPSFLVHMRAFIPENLVLVPLWCHYAPLDAYIQMHFSGDNRWYDPNLNASYRAQTITTVRPHHGRLLSQRHDPGVSKGYGVDPGIDDDYLDDCYRLDRRAVGNASQMRASGDPVGPITNRTVRTRFFGYVNSTGAPIPAIDWDFTTDLQTYQQPWSFGRQPGWHDCYPAYEIYISRRGSGPHTEVYRYAPDRRDWGYLLGCLGQAPGFPPVSLGFHAGVIQ